jgi:hypothetical protein
MAFPYNTLISLTDHLDKENGSSSTFQASKQAKNQVSVAEIDARLSATSKQYLKALHKVK